MSTRPKQLSKKRSKKQPAQQPQEKVTDTDSSPSNRAMGGISNVYRNLRSRADGLLNRRPHRSFKNTRRRDYVRSLKLPGYWAFTGEVNRLLWKHKNVFLLVVILYAVLNGVLVGLASQGTYTELSSILKDSGTDLFAGNWGQVSQAAILLGTGILGGINEAPSDAQKIFGPLIVLLIWLTTIWLLRAILANHQPKLRDGLYNAGAPIVSTFLVSLMFLVQLIPAAIATLGFWAASQTGFAVNGVESMLFWIVVSLLVVLSLYWATSTFIALVVVTLPGMYPMRAIATAGDMVIGRRIRILLRLLWVLLLVVVTWILVFIPVMLLDTWVKGFFENSDWVPTVPVLLVTMSALTTVWITTYIYLLYRKIVDDDAKPA